MKRVLSKRVPRVFAALLAAAFMMVFAFAATDPSIVYVKDATELTEALTEAANTGDETTICYLDTSLIELSGSSVSIPSNVTLNLASTAGTLRLAGGSLSVSGSGSIVGGAVSVTGGTLVRESGSSITSTITTSGIGEVRAPRTIMLENQSAADEVITAITYSGVAGADTSGYVARSVSGVIYTVMTGTNYSSYRTIETVATYSNTTGSAYVYRLGTRNVDTLSRAYTITYGGLTDATLTELNPSSYTSSDAAITLNNPTKDGFTFVGWTCDALGITVPATELVISEGTTGNLSIIANWIESTMPSGGGKSSGSGSSTSTSTSDDTDTEDAEAQQEEAAAQDVTNTTSSRHTKQASSSTKVTFTSETDTELLSLESLTQTKASFPWGWTVGGLAGLGVVIYIIVKAVERKKQQS